MAYVKTAEFDDDFDPFGELPPLDSDVSDLDFAGMGSAGVRKGDDVSADAGLALSFSCGDESGRFVVSDPNVLAALKLYSSVGKATETLLQIGACAALATSVGVDVESHRREIQHAVDATAEALAAIQREVEDAVGPEGPLAVSMAEARVELMGAMQDVIAGQVDPDAPDSLVSRLQGTVKAVEGSWAKMRGELLEEWRRTTDGQVERVERALRDMRDVDPASALGREFAAVRGGLEELKATLAAARASSAERQRGTAKGADYESQVHSAFTEVATIHGDQASWTGSQQGAAFSNRSHAKRGDVTCQIKGRDGLKIVAESMDRADPAESAVIEELHEAMTNRGAQAAIAVCSSADNRLMGGALFKPLGANLWAVVLQKEDPWVLPLQLAYCVAREAVIATVDHAAAMDLSVIQSALEELQRGLAALQTMRTYLANIRTSRDKLEVELSKYEGELRVILARALAAVAATKPAA